MPIAASPIPYRGVAPIGVGDVSHKLLIGNDLIVTKTAKRVKKRVCDIATKILDNVNNVK